MNPEAVPFTTHSNMTIYVDSKTAVLLQTAQTRIYNPMNPQCSVMVRVLLDSGSQRSYITEEVMQKLGLTPMSRQIIAISTFGSNPMEVQDCGLVTVGIQTQSENCREVSLFSVPHICDALGNQPISMCLERCEHLRGLVLAEAPTDNSHRKEIDLLIGSDYYWCMVTGRTCRGLCGPLALETIFRPCPPDISIQDTPLTLLAAHTLKVEADNYQIDKQLKAFWDLESLGIVPTEQSVYEEFTKTIRFTEGRYEVDLPWKDMHPHLPDCVRLA